MGSVSAKPRQPPDVGSITIHIAVQSVISRYPLIPGLAFSHEISDIIAKNRF